MEPYSKQADWIAFVMHSIVGAFVGCILGYYLITEYAIGLLRNGMLPVPFFLGCALVGAGLGSRLGDKLWIGLNYKVIPPDGPRHSSRSYFMAIFLTCLGAILVGLTLWKHLASFVR